MPPNTSAGQAAGQYPQIFGGQHGIVFYNDAGNDKKNYSEDD